MNKVLAFTMLRMHFEGVETFAPVLQTNGTYWLQSANSVLCGARGNEFNFTELATAKAWIDDNFARVAKSGNTAQDFILQLIIQNNASPQAYLQAEIEAIEARNAGDWNIYFADELVEKFELGYYVLDNAAFQSYIAQYMADNPITMPESVRRGTYAELQNVTLNDGELCYVTDQNILFIGDGVYTIDTLSPVATQELCQLLTTQSINAHQQSKNHFTAEEVRAIVEQAITDTYSVNPMIEKISLTAPVMTGGTAMAHDFGREPDYIKTSMICIMPEQGFSVGDEVDIVQNMPQCWANTTQFGLRVNSISIRVIHKTTSVLTVINASKWMLVVKAVKFN